MPARTHALRPVDAHQGRQGLDGSAFLSFYDCHHLWSFVWDGSSPVVEVSEGGYAEPVVYEVDAPPPWFRIPAMFGEWAALVVRLADEVGA